MKNVIDTVAPLNIQTSSTDSRTNSWDSRIHIALLVGYKSTTEHVRDSDEEFLGRVCVWI